MKTAIVIIGEPGTGKTTLMRSLIESFTEMSTGVEHRPLPLLRGTRYVSESLSPWFLLGLYPDLSDTYADGTDRLSMGVQPQFTEYVQTSTDNLIFEGDRLGSVKTLQTLSDAEYHTKLWILTAPPDILRARYAARGSNQSEAFLKGRKTKIVNVLDRADAIDNLNSFQVSHTTEQERAGIAYKILSQIIRAG